MGRWMRRWVTCHSTNGLVVTSANTVRVLSERLRLLGLDASALKPLRVAAVGRSTADALQAAGVRVDVVPERYVGESLAAALEGSVRGSRVLLARASIARDIVPDALTRVGALVDTVGRLQHDFAGGVYRSAARGIRRRQAAAGRRNVYQLLYSH